MAEFTKMCGWEIGKYPEFGTSIVLLLSSSSVSPCSRVPVVQRRCKARSKKVLKHLAGLEEEGGAEYGEKTSACWKHPKKMWTRSTFTCSSSSQGLKDISNWSFYLDGL